MLTVEKLKQCLDYNPSTGIFRWKIDICNKKIGQIAGGPSGGDDPLHPYWKIRIDDKSYYAHRLAWFYVYGIWPKPLDHLDKNKQNNAINNLREATAQQNAGNTRVRKNNGLGIKGVRKANRNYNLINPYNARIRINNKDIHLGYFKTAEEAYQAYLNAARQYYGEFASG